MAKTPMTVVNEFCMKNNMIPHYDLYEMQSCKEFGCNLSFPSPFLYDVKVTGKGKSKREAKHSAAFQALKMISIKENIPEMSKYSFELEDVKTPCPEFAENFIRKLSNTCVKNLLPSPEYETIGLEGTPKFYTMQCRVSSLTTAASAHCKKIAKQYAANSMINKLLQIKELKLVIEDTDTKAIEKPQTNQKPDENNNTILPINAGDNKSVMSTCVDLKKFLMQNANTYSRIDLSNYNDICTEEEWYFPLNYIVKQKSENLDDTVIHEMEDPKSFLEDICKLCEYKFSFYRINHIRPNCDQKYYVVLKLVTLPPWVVFGKGDVRLEAENNASRKMILFLRDLTNNK